MKQKAIDDLEKSAAFLRGWFGLGADPAVGKALDTLDAAIEMVKADLREAREFYKANPVAQDFIAAKITDELLDLLLDPIGGPLVDESVETFDIVGPVLRRPDIGKFIAGHIAVALEQLALGSASASPHPETIEVIVNGQPVIVKAGAVRDVIARAVQLSGQIGAPIRQWQLRTTEGDVIPHDMADGTDYELAPGRRLWLNLGPPVEPKWTGEKPPENFRVHLPASASPHAKGEE